MLEIGQFHWKVRCPKCQTQFDPDTGYGNDAGAPDAFISAPGWRLDHNGITLSFWVGCEWKRDAKAPVRPEQKELIESGYVEKVFTSAQLEDIVRIGDAFFAFVRERIAEFIPPPAKG